MRVNVIDAGVQNNIWTIQNKNVSYVGQDKSVSFKGVPGETTEYVRTVLRNKGIRFDASQRELPSRDFVADCIEKTVRVFERLFGSKSFPSAIVLKPIGGAMGQYDCDGNEISFDSKMSCFESMTKLKLDGLSGLYPFGMTLGGALLGIAPSFGSTIHPAHVFTHEFGHCAHYNHLKERHGEEVADKIWGGLVGTGVPTSIGRMITRFHLGDYAVASDDMCEFLAERLSADVCDGMSYSDTWHKTKDVDVNYSDIYSRKWNYRYSSPQSYIDYFTQQVWNGDLEGAKRVGADAEEYLASLESKAVPDSVAGVLEGAKQGARAIAESVANSEVSAIVSEGVEKISQGVEQAADKVKDFFSSFTGGRDKKNRLKINRWD